MPYLIDGHNLISYLDDIDLSDPHDEAKLVLKLRGFCARTRKKVTVIFDEGLPGGTSGLTTHSVHVVFASSRRTNADAIIRERIYNTPDAPNWTLVSSDNEVLDSAREQGMQGMKSADFALVLEQPRKNRPHKGINPNVYVPPNEVQEWLNIFGDDAPTSTEPTDPAPRKKRHKPHKARQIEAKSSAQPAQAKANPHKPGKANKPTIPTVNASNATAEDAQISSDSVDEWLQIFGDDAAGTPANSSTSSRPTSPSRRRKKRDSAPRSYTSKRRQTGQARSEKKPDPETASLQDVEAWLEIFGTDEETEPTDWRPQRSDPSKQGRFGKNRRGPTVHKNMATSDEIYLSDGEVEAWMDVFGVDDEDDD